MDTDWKRIDLDIVDGLDWDWTMQMDWMRGIEHQEPVYPYPTVYIIKQK